MKCLAITLVFASFKGATSVDCPCVEDLYDRMFDAQSGGEVAGLSVDFHRTLSCQYQVSDSAISVPVGPIDLYYTPINQDNRPASNLVDGVNWNYISLKKDDTETGSFRCEASDTSESGILLEDDQAQACFDMIYQVCEYQFPQVCPCFDLETLANEQSLIVSGERIVDGDKTCKEDLSVFGLVVKSNTGHMIPCVPMCSITKFGVSPDKESCYNGTDELVRAQGARGQHCSALVGEFCSSSNILAQDDNSRCKDDQDYLYKGLETRNCAWAGKKKRRCRKKDTMSKKRVFQHCRATCGYCSCEHTPSGSKCCADNDDWSRTRRGTNQNCSWLAKSSVKAFFCGMAIIAQKCPDTCGFCEIED